jgi:hypothetical protein
VEEGIFFEWHRQRKEDMFKVTCIKCKKKKDFVLSTGICDRCYTMALLATIASVGIGKGERLILG